MQENKVFVCPEDHYITSSRLSDLNRIIEMNRMRNRLLPQTILTLCASIENRTIDQNMRLFDRGCSTVRAGVKLSHGNHYLSLYGEGNLALNGDTQIGAGVKIYNMFNFKIQNQSGNNEFVYSISTPGNDVLNGIFELGVTVPMSNRFGFPEEARNHPSLFFKMSAGIAATVYISDLLKGFFKK